jgi:hypothetical protein
MSKCTDCNGKGYIRKKDPDTGKTERFHCYTCNGTGKQDIYDGYEPVNNYEEKPDNSFLENRGEENTFISDALLVGIIVVGILFLFWLFKYVWV